MWQGAAARGCTVPEKEGRWLQDHHCAQLGEGGPGFVTKLLQIWAGQVLPVSNGGSLVQDSWQLPPTALANGASALSPLCDS